VPLTRPTSKWHFVVGLSNGSPEIPKIRILVGTFTTLKPHNFVCRPLIEMKSKAKLYPLSRSFQRYVVRHLHAMKSDRFSTFSGQESNWQFDSWALFFGHNLCFRCPNGSCEFILDIYILIAFQWYKKKFNPLGLDPCTHSLNIRESTETPVPKVEAPLGV